MEVDVSYRKEQVEFVSNLSGGAVEDIILVLVHVPILVSILRFLRNPSHPSLLLSYMVVVIPTVLVLTVWSPYSFYTFLSTSGILLVLSATRSTAVSIPDCDSTPPQTNHITLFKGMFLITIEDC